MLTSIAGFLKKGRTVEPRLPASIPDGERVYAIGDIHGRNDLLVDLLKTLEADAKDFKGRVTLVCIGDYIDRGPDSKGVVNTLLSSVPAAWKSVFLRGNHEQAMLDFMADPMRGEWLAWGGVQALESYGVAPYGHRGARPTKALAAEFEYALSEAAGHWDFFQNTQFSFVSGGYLFVHAGVRPGLALASQMTDDLMFIREDFVGKPHRLPYRIVFGHTILTEPLIADDRIGLDTGAFQSGVLTAVRLEGEHADILQAVRNEAL